MKNIVFTLLLSLGLAYSQTTLLVPPVALWSAQIAPTNGASAGVLYGNGLKLTPDASSLIATSFGGTVTSYNAASGLFEWEYTPPPPSVGTTVSHSKVVFTTANTVTLPYMVYTIIENEFDASAVSRVVALDLDGTELWISSGLPGVAVGSPVVSDDGTFVFLTHNSAFNTVGSFTSLFAADGATFFSQSNATSPFAPVGIFHSPIEGNYDLDAGRGNANDFMMWSQAPNPSDSTVMPGYTFGFQFPIDFDPVLSTNVSFFLLGGDSRDFRTTTAPVMINQGLSAYFGASRSSFWGWAGTMDNPRGRFSRAPNLGQIGFTRNPTTPGQPVFATPAVSSDPITPTIFGGTAAAEVVRLSFDLVTSGVFTTTGLIKAGAIVDPFDRVAYFAEDAGFIHQFPVADAFAPIWSFNATGPVEGDMEINANGWILYVADTNGMITALKVADVPVTLAPTAAPFANTSSPTLAPVVTAAPTLSAAGNATSLPVSDVPTVAPQVPPTEAPIAAPSGSTAAQPMMILSVAAVALSLFL